MTAAQSPAAALARASALLGVGRTDSAREQIGQVLSAEPDSVEALCLLARSYHLDDNYPAMRTAAARAVAAGPDEHEAHVLLALARVELDETEAAAASAREAIRLDPDDWRGHAALATALFNLGHRRQALREARRAIEVAPRDAGPHYVRARLLHTIGWTVGAKRSYRRALALDPEHTEALVNLGRIALDGGRFGAAGRHLHTALEAAPTDDAARTQLDRLLLGGLAGWAMMGVWLAGFVAFFAMLPKIWLLPLAVLLLTALWIRRGWSRLPPGVQAYARVLLRTDVRARVRLVGLGLFTLTGTGVLVAALGQDPTRPPSVAMLVLIGAHFLALLGIGIAIAVGEHRHRRRSAAEDPTGVRQAELVAEERDTSQAGRWAVRLAGAGALLAVVPYGMTVDPAGAWPARAVVAVLALAVFVPYAGWTRRRLLRRPGRSNAALRLLLVPLTMAAVMNVVTIVASGVLPSAAMPLPKRVDGAAVLAIATGVLAWLVWLAYAAVRGLVRLLARRGAEPAGSGRLGAQVPAEVRDREGDGAALA